MQELTRSGSGPDVVVGSSIGSLVGGCYAAGRLEMLEAFARSLTRRGECSASSISSFAGSGLIGGERLRARLEAALGGIQIEDLPIRFAGVATGDRRRTRDLAQAGPLVDAIRAFLRVARRIRAGQDRRALAVRRSDRQSSAEQARPCAWQLSGSSRSNSAERQRGRGTALQGSVRLLGACQLRPKIAPVQGQRCVIARQVARGKRPGSRPDANADASAPGLVTSMVSAFDILQDRIMPSRLAGRSAGRPGCSSRWARSGCSSFIAPTN